MDRRTDHVAYAETRTWTHADQARAERDEMTQDNVARVWWTNSFDRCFAHMESRGNRRFTMLVMNGGHRDCEFLDNWQTHAWLGTADTAVSFRDIQVENYDYGLAVLEFDLTAETVQCKLRKWTLNQVDPRVEARENYADGDWVLEAALPAVVEVIPAKLREALMPALYESRSVAPDELPALVHSSSCGVPGIGRLGLPELKRRAGDRSVWLEPRSLPLREVYRHVYHDAAPAGVDAAGALWTARSAQVALGHSYNHKSELPGATDAGADASAESAARFAGLASGVARAAALAADGYPEGFTLVFLKTSVWKHRFVHRGCSTGSSQSYAGGEFWASNSLFEGCPLLDADGNENHYGILVIEVSASKDDKPPTAHLIANSWDDPPPDSWVLPPPPPPPPPPKPPNAPKPPRRRSRRSR